MIGGDFFRVGRPGENGAVAGSPTGVVRRVAEIFYSVGGELNGIAARGWANPEIVIINVGREFSVGRDYCAATSASGCATTTASSSASAATTALSISACFGGAFCGGQIANVTAAARCGDVERVAIGGKIEFCDGKMMRVESRACGGGKSGGNFCVIEGVRARALRGIDENKFSAITGGD